MRNPRSTLVRTLIGNPNRVTAPRETVVRALGFRQRLAALSEALAHATPQEAEPYAMLLLELASPPAPPASPTPLAWAERALRRRTQRRADEALVHVVRAWKRWPVALRQPALAVGEGRWHTAIGASAASVDAADRAAAAHLIAWSGAPACSGIAADLLTDDDRETARAAGVALLALAVRAAGLPRDAADPEWLALLGQGAFEPETDPAAQQRIAADIGAAAHAFGEQHRSREVLTAALLLADTGADAGPPTAAGRRLAALLDRVDHPASGALRTALRRSACPALTARAWRWLASESLGAPAAERLATAGTAGDRAAVLDLAHLALRPSRRRRVGALGVRAGSTPEAVAAAGPLPGHDGWGDLDAPLRRGLVRLARAAQIDAPTRRALLAPGVADSDACVRLAAASACDAGDLEDFAFDEAAPVARGAALRWSNAGTPASMRVPRHDADERRGRLARRLERSPHAAVRTIAQQERDRTSPWDASVAAQRVAARRWMRADPEGYTAAVRARLQGPDQAQRVGALSLIRQLGIAQRFERELIISVGPDQPSRVVATAVRALGQVRSAPARRAVDAALRASDARVRANAVEARLRQDAASAPGEAAATQGILLELKGDAHHRVRAGALRGLIEGGPPTLDAAARPFDPAGVEGLAAMLADGRPEHRLAGIWLAERTLTGAARQRLGQSWVDLVGTIAGLAGEDLAGSVRARAHRCARRLLVELRGAPEEASR